MEKRKIVFGTYDTALHGKWTLNAWAFSPAVQHTNFVTVPGRDGQLDLSTALTDGEPRYDNRTLTVRLESSEGDRMEREARIRTMINWLDGWSMDIFLPDHPLHYIKGRVHVAREFNDPAHCAVNVTATCEPWMYFKNERVYTLTAAATEKTAVLSNMGRRTAVPSVVVSGANAEVKLVYGAASWVLSAGTYDLPDLALKQGDVELQYSGTGTVVIAYREAVLE